MKTVKKAKSQRAMRVSVTGFLVCLFLASAVARLAGGTAQAIAKEVEEITQRGSDAIGFEPGGPPRDIRAEQASKAEKLFNELERRKQALDEREKALEKRRRDLESMSVTLEKKIEELSQAEARLRSVIDLASEAAEGDVAQLTSVYENMKPKEAAPLFDQMAPEFAAGFLRRMRPEVAAEIISGLEPRKAYAISVMLAGRNMDVPTE